MILIAIFPHWNGKPVNSHLTNLLLAAVRSSPAVSEPPKSGTLLTISLKKSNTLKVWTHCFLRLRSRVIHLKIIIQRKENEEREGTINSAAFSFKGKRREAEDREKCYPIRNAIHTILHAWGKGREKQAVEQFSPAQNENRDWEGNREKEREWGKTK